MTEQRRHPAPQRARAAARQARGTAAADRRADDRRYRSTAAPERVATTGDLPIAEHGIIGDLHTAALVATDGTIDWYCPERFDGPSVFAALLDRCRGGFYAIAPADPRAATKHLYLPDTGVLITRFLSPDGVGEIQDFMPVDGGPRRLIRRLVGVRGSVEFRLQIEPRFDYARLTPTVEPRPAAPCSGPTSTRWRSQPRSHSSPPRPVRPHSSN
jgi:hypothetical protein